MDHSRERLRLLALSSRVRPAALGERSMFADLGTTVAHRALAAYRGSVRSVLGDFIRE
jgi:phosphopentomutase